MRAIVAPERGLTGRPTITFRIDVLRAVDSRHDVVASAQLDALHVLVKGTQSGRGSS